MTAGRVAGPPGRGRLGNAQETEGNPVIDVEREPTADLAAIAEYLDRLAGELRSSSRWRVPEISAAGEAVACAAVLLRTQQAGPNGHSPHTDLLRDAIALARSTVETAKYAAREHYGRAHVDSTERG